MKLIQNILLVVLVVFPLVGQAETDNDWQFEITPYLWATGMKGSTGPKGLEADVDMSFGDIWDNLDKAFIINMEANKGQWSTWLDFIKMQISDDGNVTVFEVDVGMKQTLAEVAVAYQLPEHEQIELFAGARYSDVDSTITFEGTGPIGIGNKVKIGDNWIDPFLGIRGTWQLNDQWSIRARGDIGGFGVGSDFSWHAVVTANYQFNDTVSFKAGYRYLDVDYDDNDFVFDMASSGIALGVGFKF
jgi:opacity protein-like surface antigen